MAERASGMTDAVKPRYAVKSLFARASVYWVVLLLVSAVIVGTAAYSYREIDSELTSVALSRRETVAQLTAVTLAEKFGRLADVAVSLATRPGLQDLVAEGKWPGTTRFLRDVPRDLPHIERLFLTDARGTLRADAPHLPGVHGMNFASRDWFRGVSRDRRPYVSPVYRRAAAPPINVFAVAVPVRDRAGGVTGILVLQIRIEKLAEWIGPADVGPQGSIYVVDSNGRLAFHSRRPEHPEIADLSKTPVVQKLRRDGRGVEIMFDPVDREQAIVAYAAVPGYGWGVVIQQPTHAALGLAVRDEQLRRLVTGYGLILLLGAAMIFLASRIAIQRQQAEDDRWMKAELEQRVIERTAQLEAANQELEVFSYSVSHDLRAPLRALDGFSQALLEDYADRLDEDGRNYLERLRAGAQRMGLLIDDLLKLARVARMDLNRETVDLSALARDVADELRRREPHRRIELAVEPGLAADGDPRLLRVALENLLSNAWKFTGGRDAARIAFGRTEHDGAPAYFVRDNGVGFDMAYAGKLFGAFQRLHDAREFPGTGIGLATVQRVIHKHGGRVWAEAAPDNGATFYFTLPA